MSKEIAIPDEIISSKIYLIRSKKVMLDSDLAELYQVETKRLNEQVKRNNGRFPEDFMFQLSSKEWQNLKSQFATSSWGGRRKSPFVFTEHGVLMLSSILNSERAISINIQIIRVFNRIREMLLTRKIQVNFSPIGQTIKKILNTDRLIRQIQFVRYYQAPNLGGTMFCECLG